MIDLIFLIGGEKRIASLPADDEFERFLQEEKIGRNAVNERVDDIIAGKELRRGFPSLAGIVDMMASEFAPIEMLNSFATILVQTDKTAWRAFSAYFSEVGAEDRNMAITIERFFKVWKTIRYDVGVDSPEKLGKWFFETQIKALDDIPEAIVSNVNWGKVGDRILKDSKDRKAFGKQYLLDKFGLISWFEDKE